MAYNVNEERLKVRGSEQITRDLKVNRDLFVNGTADTKKLTVEDDATVKGEAIFEDDVAIHGDLYVEGTTTTTSEAQVSSSGNYVVTRDNNATPLATGEYSGLAVNNYATGKIATITADKEGTWRISDSATATATTYTNISAYNGVYYTGLSQTTTTGPSGILTNVDADELASVVKNGSSYYHKSGNDWFGPVTLVNNSLDIGNTVTDASLIAILNGLTKNDLVYYRSAIDKTIDASTNQPLLTRSEAGDLTGGQALTWDATNEKAVGKTIDTTVTANSSNLITSGAVKTAIDNEATARDNAISNAIATEVTNRNTAITNAINALDVASAGGAGKYISAISETNGKISATATTMDTAPTASSTNAVTSGGVKTAINTAETNAKNLANATGTLAIAHGGTGATTATGAEYNIIGSVQQVATAFDDNKYVAVQNQTVSANNGTFRWYKITSLWDYIKSKISSVLGLTATNYSGTSNNAKSLNGYVTCTTAAGTAAKTVDLPGFTLVKGAKLIVYVQNANTAASALTLNVNGTGAKTIKVNGTTTSSTSYSLTAQYYNCYYDGTNWCMNTYDANSAVSASSSTTATQADYTRSTAYCSTAAGTAAKVASMRGFTLSGGAAFPITFANTNTATSSLTLNINNTGAKALWINGSSTNHTLPAGTYICHYSSSAYHIDTVYGVGIARRSINAAESENLTSTYSEQGIEGTIQYTLLRLDSTNATITTDSQNAYFAFGNYLLPPINGLYLLNVGNGAYLFGTIVNQAPVSGGIALTTTSKSAITLSLNQTTGVHTIQVPDPNTSHITLKFLLFGLSSN